MHNVHSSMPVSADIFSQPVFDIDLQRKVLFANQRSLSVFGIEEKGLRTGIDLVTLVTSGRKHEFVEDISKVARNISVAPKAYTLLSKAGTPIDTTFCAFPLLLENDVVGVRTFFILEKLKHTEHDSLIAAIVVSNPDPMYLLDAGANIVLVNDLARRIASLIKGSPRAMGTLSDLAIRGSVSQIKIYHQKALKENKSLGFTAPANESTNMQCTIHALSKGDKHALLDIRILLWSDPAKLSMKPAGRGLDELPNKRLLRPSEVAEFLGVSNKTIYRWFEMGLIEGVRMNRSIRILRTSVVARLSEQSDLLLPMVAR